MEEVAPMMREKCLRVPFSELFFLMSFLCVSSLEGVPSVEGVLLVRIVFANLSLCKL